MAITEIFPNPTVKQVAFEIRFPNLFYLENKIGDVQVKVMSQFPESALLFRRQIVVADLGPGAKTEDIESQVDKGFATKIWRFRSPKGIELDVSTDSLVLRSVHHKTYNLEGADKFRDIMKFAVDSFIDVTAVPVLSRIGLRYIDECPIPSKDNRTFRSYYNSTFPLDRFDLSSATEMGFQAAVRVGDHYLRYVESLKQIEPDKYVLILDFDGFATKIAPKDYLTVADALHATIAHAYETTIREPVLEYMRQARGG
ncbi:MAG: TIGR04255 family protein [Bacteroidota bacterium]